MNILITSAGKRVSLVRMFRQELRQLFPKACVYTTDMNPDMAPAGIVSDACFPVPRVTADEYPALLLQLCKEHEIALVVPTIDTELKVLAAQRERFLAEGIRLAVATPEFIADCRDKRRTTALLTRLGIRTPEPRDIHAPLFPIFAKPYDGSLSKDLFILRSAEDITPAILEHPKLIFMEYIDKREYKEFTVDMYYGKDNRVKSIVPRERLEIRAGEINKGYTRKNHLVSYLWERMQHLPGVVGCICIQLFYRESDRDVVGIEINPRFGGGYPLSYHAGANFPQMLIREHLCGEELEYSQDWRDNTLMLRFDDEIITYEY